MDALAEQGVTLPEDWLVLPQVEAGRDQAHRFIWETGGEDRYFELLGSYLSAPHWAVRVVTFEGDVAARAEQWMVQVTGNGSIQDVRHQLPESEPGSTLTEGQALELAHAAVRTRLAFDPSDLEDVSATPSKLDARTDWVFTFADRTTPALTRGERRIEVSIAGDEVVGVHRNIHVPEEWERQQRNRRLAGAILGGLGIFFLAGILLVGGVAGVVSWSRKNFSVRICFVTFAILLLVGAAALANDWPTAMAGFSTAQPLNLQIIMFGGLGLMGLMIASALSALTCGVAPRWSWSQSCLDRGTAIQLALALGALAAGASAVAGLMPSDVAPEWPAFSGADSYVPLAAAALGPVTGYIAATAVLMVLFGAAAKFTHQWTRRTALLGALAIVTGLLLSGMNPGPEPALWAVSGTVTGLLMLAAYVFILRFDITLTPIAVAVMVILDRIPEGLHRAYPGALPGTALGIVVIAMISWWWFNELRRERAGTDEAAPLPTAA
jgi:MFS family permease